MLCLLMLNSFSPFDGYGGRDSGVFGISSSPTSPPSSSGVHEPEPAGHETAFKHCND